MNAMTAVRPINQREISGEQTGNDCCIFDQIVEVDSADDSMVFIVIDGLMTLMVYLAPVAVFGYMVAPVVARLMSMPVPH